MNEYDEYDYDEVPLEEDELPIEVDDLILRRVESADAADLVKKTWIPGN